MERKEKGGCQGRGEAARTRIEEDIGEEGRKEKKKKMGRENGERKKRGRETGDLDKKRSRGQRNKERKEETEERIGERERE